MANSLLTPTIITREALRILHANLNFIGNINRQYDSQFANSGASPSGKLGPNLTIRMPNRCTVGSGATMIVQDVTEESQVLTVSTQKHVAFNFPISDLTLTIDDFSGRYLQPFMARLATEVESDVLTNVYKDVYNLIDNDAAAISFLNYLQGRQRLNEMLAPDDGQRIALLCPTHNTKFVDAIKGNFNPQADLGQNFRKGMVAKQTAGFDFYENTLLTSHQTGTSAKATGYTVNETTAGDDGTVTVAAGANTFKKGDIITLAGCNAVHPETKADLGYLKQFVVTADYAGGAGSVSISPTTFATGARQNISAFATNGGNVVKVGAGASETLIQSLVFHPDAFTFVTADLVNPSKFGAWGDVQVQDGISMRVARQYDILNDKVPCRIDVLYGYKTLRPELAARIHADG